MKSLKARIIILLFNAVCLNAQVKTGLQVLVDHQFRELENKRVGLITNPTGVDADLHSTIDVFKASGKIKLMALFGPEHGVRGDFQAGEVIGNYNDPKTNVPVYSIYGSKHKPTAEMLKGIDVLVFDIQDIGSRSYTYISTLGLAMEAAIENNIEFMVLDRPNPLGGLKVEGPIVEPGFFSFISQYPIPYIYGLTVGELARYLNGEGLLNASKKCRLTVIEMKGWKRSMNFEETGLPWVPTSPHIPHAYSPYFYPATGIIGELYIMNIGVGYTVPFQAVAAPWINADSLADALNALSLTGLIFRPIHYKPFYSTLKGENVHGVQVYITDFNKVELTLVQFYILQECHRLWPKMNVFELCEPSCLSTFDKVCGTDKVRIAFSKNFYVSDLKGLWMDSNSNYRQAIKKYYLY